MNLTRNTHRASDALIEDQRKRRMKSTTYKIYLVVLLLLVYFIWPPFMQKLTYVYGDGYVAALWSEYRMHGFSADFGAVRGANSLEDHYQRQQERLTELRQRIDVAQQENALVRWLATASNGDTIRRCINDNVCNTLTPALHANIDLFRKFYALGSP